MKKRIITTALVLTISIIGAGSAFAATKAKNDKFAGMTKEQIVVAKEENKAAKEIKIGTRAEKFPNMTKEQIKAAKAEKIAKRATKPVQ